MISARVKIVAEIVATFVLYNSVPLREVPTLIESLHDALDGAEASNDRSAVAKKPNAPAVPVRDSVTPDYLICLEDGKRLKYLRRHLIRLSMTPAEYRLKWGLPLNYPMVAPNYSAKRSKMARQSGLGRKRDESAHREAGQAATKYSSQSASTCSSS